MKDLAINAPRRIKDGILRSISKTLIIQFIYFTLGLLSSRGSILGDYSPFGTAFVAAAPWQAVLWDT